MSERTIQNYRKRADFQAEYEAAAARVMEERREARKAETATLTEARALAIKTLRRECTSTEMKHTTAGSYDMNAPNRIRAAKALLDLTAPGAKTPNPDAKGRTPALWLAPRGAKKGSPLLSSPLTSHLSPVRPFGLAGVL